MNTQESFPANLSKGSKIYFIGIGGIGMSALARIFKRLGYEIKGSDCQDSEILRELAGEGIQTFVGHSHREPDVSLAVYSTAIYDDNPEKCYFQDSNVPTLHRSALLAYLLNNIFSVGVTGTHGKTTTSALISYLAETSSLDPTAIIGGYMKNFKSNALFGNNELIVAEVDESDKTQLACQPNISVITNLEPDHLENYQNMEGLEKAFQAYLSNLSSESSVVYWNEDPKLKKLVKDIPQKKISFGFNCDADYGAANIKQTGHETSFTFLKKGKSEQDVTIPMRGEHNVLNVLASFAVLELLGISPEKTMKQLANFSGVGRRMDFLLESSELSVVDDYAHHPTEIEHVIKSLKEPKKRLIVIFEPHRYTRTQHLLKEFGTAFEGADVLFLTDIYSAGELPIDGVAIEGLYHEVIKHFKGDCKLVPKKKVIETLRTVAQKGDIIAFLGAGEVTNLAQDFCKSFKINDLSYNSTPML